MSDGGGDAGGDAGSGGKGGGGIDDSGSGWSNPDYTPPTAAPSPAASDPSSYATSPGEQAGFQGSGDLPSEITTGSSSPAGSDTGVGSGLDLGSTGGSGSLSDFLSGNGFNLAGSGPVGGSNGSPIGVSSDVFSSDGGNATPVTATGSTDPLGTTAPSSGGGTSAMAFAAPAGVSGSPDLSSLVSDPTTGATGGATPPAGGDVFSSLNGAQAATANDYATATAPLIPSALDGSTTLPATATPTSGSGSLSDLVSGSSSSSGKGSGDSSGSSGSGNGLGLNLNTAGIALAGAGLLNNLISGNKSVPAVGDLKNAAATATGNSADMIAKGNAQGAQFGTPALQSGQDQTAKGAALQQFVATGTLPQGYEDQVQQAAQAAKQTIISNYANRGLPTDPSKNSALAQELSQVDARLPAAREQLATQLANTGNSIVASGNATSSTGNALTANGLLTDGLTSAGISSNIYQTLANLENSQNQQRGAAIANFASALNGGNKGLTVNLGTSKAA